MEIFRLAEREVNSYLALIKQQNIKNWNDQDYLSMTALKFAIAHVGMRQSREVDDEDLRQLEKIGTEIYAFLNVPLMYPALGLRCRQAEWGGFEKGGNRPERHAPFEKRSFTYKNLPA